MVKMCEIIAKAYCYKCKKPIYHGVCTIPIEGKTRSWNPKTNKWDGIRCYHPECAPRIIDNLILIRD